MLKQHEKPYIRFLDEDDEYISVKSDFDFDSNQDEIIHENLQIDKPRIILVKEAGGLGSSVKPTSNKLSISPKNIEKQKALLGKTVSLDSQFNYKNVSLLIFRLI